MSLFDAFNQKLSKIADNQEQKKTSQSSIGDIMEQATTSTLQRLSGRGLMGELHTPDNVIAFMGVSGGVGTTTTVVNVATAIRTAGKSVLVIDANILNPMVNTYIPYKQDELTRGDLCSYLAGEHALGDSISYNNGQVSLMTSLNRDIQTFVAVDREGIDLIVEQYIDDVRNLFDIILIDVPTFGFTSDIVNAILFRADKIYLVFDEGINCISGTERLRINLTRCGISTDEKMKNVIFNKRTNIHYPRACFEKMGLNVVSVLPFEIGVVESGLQGVVYLTGGIAKGPYAKAFCKEVENLANYILDDCTYTPEVLTEAISEDDVHNAAETEDVAENDGMQESSLIGGIDGEIEFDSDFEAGFEGDFDPNLVETSEEDTGHTTP